VQRLLEVFGRDRVYVELQRHLVRGEERVNRRLIDLAEQRLQLLQPPFTYPPDQQVRLHLIK